MGGKASRPSTDPNRVKGKTGSFSTETTPGLCTLSGLTNTMNAVMQCLLNTKPLVNYFLLGGYNEELPTSPPAQKTSVNHEIAELFKYLCTVVWSGHHKNVSAQALKMAICRYSPLFEEDCDGLEMITGMLDALHEDLNRVRRQPPLKNEQIDTLPQSDHELATRAWRREREHSHSIIYDLFEGMIKGTVTCLECNKISKSFDPFLTLTLSIPDNERGTYSLVNLLDQFVAPDEDYHPKNSYYCETCQKKVTVVVQNQFWSLPQVLIIHFRRYRRDPTNDRNQKLNNLITFPAKNLDVSRVIQGPKTNSSIYYLTAVLNHESIGDSVEGHYSVVSKNHITKNWYCIDDSTIEETSEESVVVKKLNNAFTICLHKVSFSQNGHMCSFIPEKKLHKGKMFTWLW